MAHIISVQNVNGALVEGLNWLKVAGVFNDSRNGMVLQAPGPVITEYRKPDQRVLFCPRRDANPFFHFMEAMWMLAGRNDVAMPQTYAKQLGQYSDDGVVLWGAYGYRWRKHYDRDQIVTVVEELRRDHLSRRCVIAMWDPTMDIAKAAKGGKDVPCNTHIYFDASRGSLDMTVCCRSNDAIWGAYGANAVHFSMLMELVAQAIGMNVGSYHQVSNNFHIYADRPDVQRLYDYANREVHAYQDDRYASGLSVTPMLTDMDYRSWLAQVGWFCEGADSVNVLTQPFLRDVARPLRAAHRLYQMNDLESAKAAAADIAAADWRIACLEWLDRRTVQRAMRRAAILSSVGGTATAVEQPQQGSEEVVS